MYCEYNVHLRGAASRKTQHAGARVSEFKLPAYGLPVLLQLCL